MKHKIKIIDTRHTQVKKAEYRHYVKADKKEHLE